MYGRLPIKLQALQKRLKRCESVIGFGNEFDSRDRKKNSEPLVFKKPVRIHKENVALIGPRAARRSSQPRAHICNVREGGLEDDNDVKCGAPGTRT